MLKKLNDFLKNNAFSKQLIAWSKKIVLPGFEGMTLYVTLHFLFQSFSKSQYGIRSSAISFKFFMALFPGIIFFLSLIPYIPIENFQSNLLEGLCNMLPSDVYALIENTVNDLINHKHSGVLSIGFFLSLYFASNGINTLLTAFNSSHQLQLKRKPIRQRLISLGIFGIISISFIIALSAIMLGEYFAYNKDYQSLGFAIRTGYQLLKWGIIIISLIFNNNIQRCDITRLGIRCNAVREAVGSPPSSINRHISKAANLTFKYNLIIFSNRLTIKHQAS